MKVLKVGIVGFGYMGKMHSLCYSNIPYYYKTDIHPELYAVASSKSPGDIPVAFEKYYATADELVDDPEVDIIDICSPNYMHKDLLLKAIANNKYIYCEKPLAANYSDAEEIMDALRKYGYNKTNRVVFEYRFIPAIIRAKQIIKSGGIGRIINFNFRYYGSEFLDPERPISWQSTKALSGGGVLYALGTHSIDLIRFLIGDISSVFAQKETYFKKRPLKNSPGQFADVGIEDLVNAQMSCVEGAVGTLQLSQVAAGCGTDFTFEIYGEKGALRFNHANANVLQYYSNLEDKSPCGGFDGWKSIETTQKYGGQAVFPPPRVTISWIRYHIASVYDFLCAISEGRDSAPDLKDGYMVSRVTDAIYRSCVSGHIEIV